VLEAIAGHFLPVQHFRNYLPTFEIDQILMAVKSRSYSSSRMTKPGWTQQLRSKIVANGVVARPLPLLQSAASALLRWRDPCNKTTLQQRRAAST
jgi:hypothetical protein